jgi:hypothetical protein
LTLGLAASAVIHVVLFAFLTIDVPVLDEEPAPRPLRVVELPEDDALEVVPLESFATLGASSLAGAEIATVLAAETPAGPVGAAAAISNPVPMPAAAPSAALDLAPVASREAATPILDARPANRGVVLARGGGPAARTSDFDFARDDEGAWALGTGTGAAGRGGSGGIGISIMGIGGDGHCPTGGLGGIDLTGPGGGLPAPRGRGIIGRRPPGGEAINRSLPGGRDR